jgi:hypothetical protein
MPGKITIPMRHKNRALRKQQNHLKMVNGTLPDTKGVRPTTTRVKPKLKLVTEEPQDDISIAMASMGVPRKQSMMKKAFGKIKRLFRRKV